MTATAQPESAPQHPRGPLTDWERGYMAGLRSAATIVDQRADRVAAPKIAELRAIAASLRELAADYDPAEPAEPAEPTPAERAEMRRDALTALRPYTMPADAPGAWIRAAIDAELGSAQST